MTKLKLLSVLIVVLFMFTSCIGSKGVAYKQKKNQEYVQDSKNKLDHSNWDKLLKKHVRDNGNVNYEAFKADVDRLNEYIRFLQNNIPQDSWSFEEQLAYYINVYNANTIKLIVDNYPVESIKKVDATISPFLKNFIYIGDKEFSLADIEKGILQKMNEPRIHFAINCASISCPKLLNTAYTAENVDNLMEKAAKQFINSSKNEISENKANLSSIFKWYKSDFLQDANSLIEYVNRYSNVTIKASVKPSFKDYNWGLNDTK